MQRSNADYQREHRQRRARRLAELEASAAEHDVIVATLTAERDAALAEVERLSGLACKHPSAVVLDGCCRACGAEVW
jgi:hypothetical protein